ncbi:hypothetical protein ACMU_18750 [Actibacterium mucosum KCTC 23349]|uniref:Glutathione metabolism protein n=1 Tax=Actibacterium mucosum KCTC 23349 TaxID=1454373 RepID=A0A037ZHI0_9RHOB|nr:MAPEG family protein [Actibacterium mucosum]KAJ54265.1 hypothetical protein ACMU_18750 [Actibacterium mucosum KCTC 23349]
MPEITPIYAALLTFMYLALCARVIRFRRSARVSLGTGGNETLEARIRAQSNCAEYAPIGLILMLILELQGAHWSLMHLLGLMLLVGRGLHAAGLSAAPQNFAFRTVGMMLTLTMIGGGAVATLVLVLAA